MTKKKSQETSWQKKCFIFMSPISINKQQIYVLGTKTKELDASKYFKNINWGLLKKEY